MMRFRNVFWLLFFLCLGAPASAGQSGVQSLRHWIAPDHSRLVFDLSSAPSHHVFLLENPDRLVIDLDNARLTGALSQPAPDHPFFRRVRSGIRNKTGLRVVLDMKTGGNPKVFTLTPNAGLPYRLVIDLFEKGKTVRNVKEQKVADAKEQTVANVKLQTPNKVAAVSAPVEPLPTPTSAPKKSIDALTVKKRDIVIAVDAGHGGEDPGAHGTHGTWEKDVTFSIARKLAALIDRTPGMKAVMVRKGDYYIDLRKRMHIARDAKADLFISIHADAFRDAGVKGASVFTLSNRGATSEASRWLANNENAADLVGGVSLDDKEDVLASVLLDLSQTATQEASFNVAGKVLKNLRQIGPLHQHTVQKAGFVVLKSPDVPSILVETAFISNPGEERKLTSGTHQDRLARAILNGVENYFSQYAPPDTLYAKSNQKHVISRGETLSGIAQQYGVSMHRIKAVNELGSNEVRIGQVLDIPTGS